MIRTANFNATEQRIKNINPTGDTSFNPRENSTQAIQRLSNEVTENKTAEQVAREHTDSYLEQLKEEGASDEVMNSKQVKNFYERTLKGIKNADKIARTADTNYITGSRVNEKGEIITEEEYLRKRGELEQHYDNEIEKADNRLKEALNQDGITEKETELIKNQHKAVTEQIEKAKNSELKEFDTKNKVEHTNGKTYEKDGDNWYGKDKNGRRIKVSNKKTINSLDTKLRETNETSQKQELAETNEISQNQPTENTEVEISNGVQNEINRIERVFLKDNKDKQKTITELKENAQNKQFKVVGNSVEFKSDIAISKQKFKNEAEAKEHYEYVVGKNAEIIKALEILEKKYAETPTNSTHRQAEQIIQTMTENAEIAPTLELTPENWDKEFGENGIVETPIGEVKIGENQYLKILKNKRDKQFGMIKPTLTNPDVIIEMPSQAKKGQKTERETSLLFVKTFDVNGKKVRHFESVTIKKDGREVSISSHIIKPKQLLNKLEKGNVLWNKHELSYSETSDKVQTLDEQGTDSPSTNTHGSLDVQTHSLSDNKDTKQSNNSQTKSEQKATDNEVVKNETPTYSTNQSNKAETKLSDEIEVTTSTNEYTVKNNNGTLEITAKYGGKRLKLSESEKKRIRKEYRDKLDYNKGEGANFEGMENATPQQQAEVIAEKSNNAYEIAQEYKKSKERQSTEKENAELSKDGAIAQVLKANALTDTDAKKHFTDINQSYTNTRGKRQKLPLDMIAERANELGVGEVSVQDVMDFIERHEKLSDFNEDTNTETNIQQDLKRRFKKVTGLTLTDRNADIATNTKNKNNETNNNERTGKIDRNDNEQSTETNIDDEVPFQKDKDGKFKSITETAFNALIDRLKKPFKEAFKNLDVVTEWSEFAKRHKDLKGINSLNDLDTKNVKDVDVMKTPKGVIYGAKLPDGTIYINPKKLNANTPIHEFSHLWEQLMPEQWKKGVELFKDTNAGKKLFAELKDNGNYKHLSDQELWSEAVNTYIGNLGEKKYHNNSKLGRFAEWVKDTFKKLGAKLNIGNLKAETKFKDFANGVLNDLMGEKELKAESKVSRGNVEIQFSKDVPQVNAETKTFKDFSEVKKWAKENITGTYTNKQTNEDIKISNTSIDKFLSGKSISKSSDLDSHISVLNGIPEFVKNAVLGKTENFKDPNNEQIKDVQKFYGVINGKAVKLTVKRYTDSTPNKAYSYEVQKIETLDKGNLEEHYNNNTTSSNLSSVSIANIIKTFDEIENNSNKVDFQTESTQERISTQELKDQVEVLFKTGFSNETPVLASDSKMGKIFGLTANGTPPLAGVKDGVVYINKDRAKKDTPINAFGSIWINFVKKNHKAVYARAMELIKNETTYVEQARRNAKEGATETLILEEALTQAIGDKGAKILSRKNSSKFQRWFNVLFDKIAKGLGLKNMSAERLSKVNFEQFTDLASAELLAGRNIEYDSKQVKEGANNRIGLQGIELIVGKEHTRRKEREEILQKVTNDKEIEKGVKQALKNKIICE
ncbi:MAG: hypothetical protein KGV59_05045 [Tenacibaculum sp.]|nr:hypothetical protein [Tenacibaculum sp.]